jgi:hypothetical protein
MDFSKLSQVLGRNKEQDPNFGQFVQENAEGALDQVKEPINYLGSQIDANLQEQEADKNKFIEAIKAGKFDREASRRMVENGLSGAGVGGTMNLAAREIGALAPKVEQMAAKYLAPKVEQMAAMEANAIKAGGPSSERFVVGAGKPVQISDGSKSVYGKNSPGNLRLRKLMEEQAKAKAAANAPLNALDKSKIIIP